MREAHTDTESERIRCVASDPPWYEHGGGKYKRGADRHYPILGKEKIRTIMAYYLGIDSEGQLLEHSRIGPSCHLWLWSTDNHLLDALYVMQALGFRYVRTLCWVKVRPLPLNYLRGTIVDALWQALRWGLGQYLRGSHELCLFGVRGQTTTPVRAPRSVVFADRRKHSDKPDEAFDVFEQVSPGPRLEMFARKPRDGWDVWGNEV